MDNNKYKIITIEKQFSNLRIDKFLFGIFTNINNILIQKALRNKDILVNSQVVESNYKLKENDDLMITNFISKVFNQPSKKITNKKQLNFTDKEIEKVKNYIIYKDDHILAINKPVGLAVQSGTKIEKSLNDFLPYLKFENKESPRLIHRLDKDTSGAIILARDKESSEILSEYFKEKDAKLEKIYLVIAIGNFTKESGTINFPLIKKIENNVEKVYRDEKDGKEAITIYKVLGYSEKYDISLLEVKILTGRTHQIRVHLKEYGHPILGDGKYGGKKAFIDGLSDKMHLHSYRININDFHDRNTNIKAELPDNFKKTLRKSGIKFN